MPTRLMPEIGRWYAHRDKGLVFQVVAVDEAGLKAYYESIKARVSEPEKRHARHIFLSTGTDEAATKKKAEDIAKQAKNGGNFIELAKKNSDDTGNAPNGGDLGTFGRGQMVPEFENAVFAMKPGDVSGVVTTQFGYHIIKLEDTRPAQFPAFDDVKAQIKQRIEQQKMADFQESLIKKAKTDYTFSK